MTQRLERLARSARVRWAIARSGDAAKVLYGRDGWLFLQNDANGYIRQLTGRTRFNEEELDAWRKVLRARVDLMRELDIRWICRIAPEKHPVYSEFLPSGLIPGAKRPVHQFIDVAHQEEAPVDYLLGELEALKPEAQLYSRTDTHWNHRGAYFVYRSMCRDLGALGVVAEPVSEDGISWESQLRAGDLGSKLPRPIADTVPAPKLREHRGRLVFDNGVLHHGAVMVFESDRKPAPTAVLMGESYAPHLLLFLKETFSRLVFVHSSTIDRTLLETERPDVLITVPTERFLIALPDDSDARDQLVQTAADKIDSNKVRGKTWFDEFLADTPGAFTTRVPATAGTIPW